jgi:hypothetical protein
VLGVGTLFAVALLSVASERLQPIAVVLAVLSIGVLVLVQELSRRILILLALDAAIVFLYLWALDQPLHIVIQGDRSQYVVTVGDRTAAFPASGGGRIGLYTGRSSDYTVSALGDAPPPSGGPVAALAEALRFAGPGPAWANVHVNVPGGTDAGDSLFRLPASGWSTNRRGELAPVTGSAPVFSSRVYTRYTLSAELMRPEGTQGVLLGVARDGHGYLLTVRMDNEAASWNSWHGRSFTPLAGAPFSVDAQGMVRRALRAVLPSAFFAFLLITLSFALRLGTRFSRLWQPPRQISLTVRSPLVDVSAVVIALGGGVAAATIASTVFARTPNVQDGVAYLFQAKTLALGRLWVPTPSMPSFFRVEFIPMYHGHWFGKYPPGWPMLLAIGVLAGQPWLVNPALVTADLLLLYWIGLMAYGREVALIAVLFAATSPMLLFVGASFMAHAATLFFASGFVALILRWETNQRARSSGHSPGRGQTLLLVGAGFLIGMAFMTREVDALALAVPFAVLFVRRLRAGACVVAGAISPAVLWLGYNRLLTGSFTTTPYALWWSFDRIGFGATVGGPETAKRGFTFAQGLWNLGTDLQSFQAHVFGWPFYAGLALAAIPFLAGRIRRWDVLFAASACSVTIAYVFYFNPGLWYGPRYYYVIVPWVALLSARGLVELYRLCVTNSSFIDRVSLPAVALPALLATALIAYDVGFYIPSQIPTYQGWNATSARTARALQSRHLQNAVVFTAGHESVFDVAFSLNAPLLNGSVVYAKDEGSRDSMLMTVYPHRAYYRYSGTSPERLRRPPRQ